MSQTESDREWEMVIAACWDHNFKPPAAAGPPAPEVEVSMTPDPAEVDSEESDTGLDWI